MKMHLNSWSYCQLKVKISQNITHPVQKAKFLICQKHSDQPVMFGGTYAFTLKCLTEKAGCVVIMYGP